MRALEAPAKLPARARPKGELFPPASVIPPVHACPSTFSGCNRAGRSRYLHVTTPLGRRPLPRSWLGIFCGGGGTGSVLEGWKAAAMKLGGAWVGEARAQNRGAARGSAGRGAR